MKILLIGNKGMLGTDTEAALKEHELVGVDIDGLDIRNLDAVLNYISAVRPEIVVNCTGYTNVDACETEIDAAFGANSIGPRNLAIACNKHSAALVHVSTDYVFDGEAGQAYNENDFVNPLSVYGKSKLAGENYVKELTNRYFIVRTQWLYGKNGKNFIKTMLRLADEKTNIKVVNDQFGSPTFSKDLAAAISKLIMTEAYGTYHITNSGITSWYQFALDIFKISGINADISPCLTEDYPVAAHRPKYSVLNNSNWVLSGFEPLRNYKDALCDYLNN